MSQEYLKFLVEGMEEMFDGVLKRYDRSLLMASTMCRFLNCNSYSWPGETGQRHK